MKASGKGAGDDSPLDNNKLAELNNSDERIYPLERAYGPKHDKPAWKRKTQDDAQYCDAPSCWRTAVTQVYGAWLCRPCRKRALEVS